MSEATKHTIFYSFLILLGILFVFVFVYLLFFAQQDAPVPTYVKETAPTILEIEHQAEAVAVYDIAKGKMLYEKNSDAVLPLASITKIMTALVALENAVPESPVTISEEALAQEGNNFLVAGETWKLEDLIAFMLLTSSNDAAYQIANSIEIDGRVGEEVFINAMNKYALEQGLYSMSFENASGLDTYEETASSYGSARDVAQLLIHATERYPHLFEVTSKPTDVFTSQEFPNHIGINTNVLASSLPGLVSSKTGYTDLVGGNLAFLFEAGPGRPIAVVVMRSSFTGRFDDAERIVSTVLESLRTQEE